MLGNIRVIGAGGLAAVLALTVPIASVLADQPGKKPGWLARTSGEFQINSDTDPRGSIETVQPLLQSAEDSLTLFVQGRAAYRDGDWTTNVGAGLRYLMPSQMWMIGVNGWYDRTYDEDHERFGVGAELFGPLLTGRFNYYDATSGTKTVATTATTVTQERAVDGYDFELEGPVPYLPWARLGVTYFEWDTDFISNIDGFSLDLKMDLTDWARLEVSYQDDDVDEIFSASLRIRFGAPSYVQHTAARDFRSDRAFVPRDVSKQSLARVERHHGVVVERRTVNTATGAVNGAVIIGRGT